MVEEKKTKRRSLYTWAVPKASKDSDYTFEELYEEYYNFFIKAAYSKTGHMQDAEDLVQEIFLRVLIRFGTISPGRVSNCLSRLATQAHIDWYRKVHQQNLDIRCFDDLYSPESRFFDIEDPNEKDPFLNLLKIRSEECMTQQLSMLSILDTKLFMMVHMNGVKVQEAADELSLSKTNAETRLWRIKNKLSSCLSRDDVLEMA